MGKSKNKNEDGQRTKGVLVRKGDDVMFFEHQSSGERFMANLKALLSKIKFAFVSGVVMWILLPFYREMVSVQLIVEGNVFEAGWIIAYVFLTIMLWLILHILFYYRGKTKEEREFEQKSGVTKK